MCRVCASRRISTRKRDARGEVDVAADIIETGEAARKRAGGGVDQRRGERAQERHRQKRQLKAGIEELIGIEQQEADGHGRQQIQRTPLAIEVAGDAEQRQSGGGAHARGAPSRHQRVKPHHGRGDEEGGAFRHEADSQQKEEERGQNRHVGAGDDQRVEGAGVAVVLRPDALKLIILADEDGLHHGDLIRVAFIHARDAGERGAAQIHDELLKGRAAMARQDANGAGGAGGRPVDVALREVMRVVECAGVAVVVRLADLASSSMFWP